MWVFVRSLLIALLFVLAFEGTSRKMGWLDPTLRPDPYLGFPGTSPLYRATPGAGGTVTRTRSPNKPMYREETFTDVKGEREFRAFCIGGSSVRSDAFMDPDGSFPFMLWLYLRSALLGDAVEKVQVVNAGGGAMGSIQNLEVLREVLDYEPDLIVVYPEGGEKNFIPPNPNGVLARSDDASPLKVECRKQLTRLRLYQGVRDVYRAAFPPASEAPPPASAFSAFIATLINQPFAPEIFDRLLGFKVDRPPLLMEPVLGQEEIDHAHRRFQRNLETMARLCRERAVPLVFVLPVRNLHGSFYLRFHVTPEEIAPGRIDDWRQRYADGLAAKKEQRYADALAILRSIRELYVVDRDEILAFYLGECLEALGRQDEALEEYAKPYLRHPMREQIAAVAARENVPLVDPYPALLAASETGIPGYAEFTDSFHPMPKTNRVIARAIYECLATEVDSFALPPLDSPRLANTDEVVANLCAKIKAPLATQMLRATLEGRDDHVVRLAATIPESVLLTRSVEPLYLMWSLCRLGEVEKAREFFLRMRGVMYQSPLFPREVVLETDEDIVRVAFGGDLFHWF
jgi:tetratricopeptide (TPR) repeat protein